jgi:acetylornithine deacetylase/succinyl-diaminopimelate desuccinylase-like protein
MREEVTTLLRRLIACDTSNPPGNEAQAAAILEDHLVPAGIECRRVAKDPARPNLLARLPGLGAGPSLAFLGHLDVVQARREDWSVEPFAGVERDGAIWGRGTIDMKCQVAATAVALATLGREGARPAGDLMLILTADEEVGEAQVGAPHLIEELPDLCPDYVVGEGAGERIVTPNGPIYMLDHGVKATTSVTVTVRGRAADASLPGNGASAVFELARLLGRLESHEPEPNVLPELEPLLAVTSGPGGSDADRVARARAAHPALDRLVGALVANILPPTVVEAHGPANVVRERATVTLQCSVLPRTTKDELEAEVRSALGEGDYDLEVGDPQGGSTSPLDTPLHAAIESFLAEADPEATLVPTLGYGFSDCHFMRSAYDSVAYGFIPFRHADPVQNLETKHGADERILVDDLLFQTECALAVAREIGQLVPTARRPRASTGRS